MVCFYSCVPRHRKRECSRIDEDDDDGDGRSGGHTTPPRHTLVSPSPGLEGKRRSSAESFSFRQLATATQNFNGGNLIGEGGFGRVFKGRLASGQVVAIKQLNRDGLQGNTEFLVEILMLITLQHPNLVDLVGYCAEGDERLLVYEYMPHGSLEDHLFDSNKKPLEWNTRIKIAIGAAKGLTYLHNVANPPVIYRDMKAANILLDYDFNPKLSDFGLAKLGPVGDNTHVSTRVMGTYGYCAPDYAMSGKLTLKSDVYSFGVLLLELITGRKAYDVSRAHSERNLMIWSRPFLLNKMRHGELVDPGLGRRYPPVALGQLVTIASMCVVEQPHFRPIIADVVEALYHVASRPYIFPTTNTTTTTTTDESEDYRRCHNRRSPKAPPIANSSSSSPTSSSSAKAASSSPTPWCHRRFRRPLPSPESPALAG